MGWVIWVKFGQDVLFLGQWTDRRVYVYLVLERQVERVLGRGPAFSSLPSDT